MQNCNNSAFVAKNSLKYGIDLTKATPVVGQPSQEGSEPAGLQLEGRGQEDDGGAGAQGGPKVPRDQVAQPLGRAHNLHRNILVFTQIYVCLGVWC